MDISSLPAQIRQTIADRPFEADDIGRSDSSVLLFADMVLKIEKTSPASDRELAAMQWLESRLPVPKVLDFARQDGKNHLLMSRLPGEMACSPENLARPEETVAALAEGIRTLWQIDISHCPLHQRLDDLLAALPDTPEADRLRRSKPEEDPVFGHGDYCLPNVFLSGGRPVGYLDLGYAGVADRWQDIAMCLWSMEYNFCQFGGLPAEDFPRLRAHFFDCLGIAPDEEKLAWHAALNALF